ncbi:MAG: AAA family ATPase, partial [Succinivibrio sp.]|nr:AAA family ATPase [Succinivibrio sp.]
MANYLNPDHQAFERRVKSGRLVDKSPILHELNNCVNDEDRKFVCISRPRRFGKSVTAEMLCAYYGQGDSAELFAPLQIAQDESYRTHLNQYHVIFINMNDEFSRCHHDLDELKSWLGDIIGRELKQLYPELKYSKDGDLNLELQDACAYGKRQFVVIIDEWDCVMREKAPDADIKAYLDFLEGLFKGKSYIALAYLTGILPIKKYGKHSAINMFKEYEVTNPGVFAPYLGFTEDEVSSLCVHNDISFEMMKQWYDGYTIGRAEHIFNPNSVVNALVDREFRSYWTRTETWEALAAYLKLNHQGLKDEIVKLLAGETVRVDVSTFENDMTTFKSRDDVLTLLTHLGYLSAEPDNFGDPDFRILRIPNRE